ncbi:MAG TPA: hypothetical protein VMF61_04980 [Candidatus Acidoferrales bacterium]|nr:hypothetical protein [Candidatus Acidoferrales bacterium]
MTARRWARAAAAALALPLLAVSAKANPWDVNIANGYATLVNVSPVAARVEFDNGTVRTFALSHADYDRLRDMRGLPLSFQVRHDVLSPVSG